jgi:DNA-directed RNA polymerase specialized sigma24 family protein
VAELLQRMPPEAPAGYVSFVSRHLSDLRTESARLVGDDARGEEIYPEALADVAARWRWYELMRTRLGRPAAADEYLRRVLETRAQKWRDDQVYPVEVVVTRADGISPLPPPPFTPRDPHPRPEPIRISLGLRQAAFLSPGRHLPTAIAEAAIAWWHAYEATRRRRRVAVAVAVGLVFAALYNLAVTNRLDS